MELDCVDARDRAPLVADVETASIEPHPGKSAAAVDHNLKERDDPMILFAAVVAAVSGVPGALEGSVRVVRGRRLLSEASMRPRSTPSRTSFCEVQPSTCSTSSRPYGSPIWTLSTRAAKARGATALCLLLPHERDDLTALHLHARAHHAQMVELGMDARTVTTALDLEEGLRYLKRAAGPSPHRNGFAGCSP